jgi:hypothetical protein
LEGAGPVSLVAPGPVPDGDAPNQTPQRVVVHYTHELHAVRCVEAAQHGRVLQQFVQVKLGRKYAFAQCCARVLRPWRTDDGFGMWRLQIALPGGQLIEGSVPVSMVRQCSGVDTLCACAGEQPRAAAGRAGCEGCSGAVASNTAQTAHE